MRFIYLSICAVLVSFSVQAMDGDLERYAVDARLNQFIHQKRPTKFDEFQHNEESPLLRLGHNLAEIDSQFIGKSCDEAKAELEKAKEKLEAYCTLHNMRVPTNFKERLAVSENGEFIYLLTYVEGYTEDEEELSKRHEELTYIGSTVDKLLHLIKENPHVIDINNNFAKQLKELISHESSPSGRTLISAAHNEASNLIFTVTDFFEELLCIHTPVRHFNHFAVLSSLTQGLDSLPPEDPFKERLTKFFQSAEEKILTAAYQEKLLREYAIKTYKLFLQIVSDYKKQRLAEIAAGEETPVIGSADAGA